MSSACVDLANNLPEQLRRLVMPDAPPHGLQAAIATELLGCLDTTSCLTLSATSRGLMADVGRSLTTLHLQRYDAVRGPSHNKDTARKARAALDRVLRRYSSLREISVHDVWVDQSVVDSIAAHCPRLSSLWLYGFQVASLEPLLACSHLQRLVLDSFSRCDVETKITLNGPIFRRFVDPRQRHCSSLTSLTLEHSAGWITDAALVDLAMSCRSLRELNMDYEDKSLYYEGEYVILEDEQYLSDRGFTALAFYCPQLEALRGEWLPIGDAGLLAIGRRCRNLRVLHLDENIFITKAGYAAFAAECSEVLDTVIFSFGQRNHYAPRNLVDGSTIVRCLTEHPRPLRNFGCAKEYFDADERIEDLLPAFLRLHPLLVAVDLDGCMVDDTIALALAEHCPGLRRLLIPQGNMTDVGVIALAESCDDLEQLRLSPNTYSFISPAGAVTVASIHALAKLRSLKSLSLHLPESDCADQYVKLLAAGLPSLTEWFMGRASQPVVASIASERPGLLIIHSSSKRPYNMRRGPTLTSAFHVGEPVYWVERRYVACGGYGMCYTWRW